jgi:hypothetical protein
MVRQKTVMILCSVQLGRSLKGVTSDDFVCVHAQEWTLFTGLEVRLLLLGAVHRNDVDKGVVGWYGSCNVESKLSAL